MDVTSDLQDEDDELPPDDTSHRPTWEDTVTSPEDASKPLSIPPLLLNELTKAPPPCPLQPRAWLEALQNYPNQNAARAILRGIQQGVNICFSPTTNDPLHRSPNATGSDNIKPPEGREQEATDFARREILSDVEAGRRIGPFRLDSIPFPDYRISPCGVIPKKGSQKLRLIHHLSWPRPFLGSRGKPGPSSVNANITPLRCQLASFDDAIRLISNHKEQIDNLFMFKIDIKSAYRCIPVRAQDQHLLGLIFEDQYYFDLVLAFGLTSSCSIFEVFSTAIDWILQNKIPELRHRLIHYIDDFFGLCVGPITGAQRTLQRALLILRYLGVPVAPEKIEGPARLLSFLGITIDLVKRQIRLDDEKLATLKELISSWLQRSHCTYKDIEAIAGSLYWATKVVRGGRTFLRRVTDAKSKRLHRGLLPIEPELKADLSWWSRFLIDYNGQSMLPESDWTTTSTSTDPNSNDQVNRWILATDAAKYGYGARWNNHYLHGTWSPSQIALVQHDQGINISALELGAIVIATLTWGNTWKGKRILFQCDNEAAVTAINTGACKNERMMELTRELWFICCVFDCELRAVHVPGITNIDADLLSRGEIDMFLQRHPLTVFLPSIPQLPISLR